MTTYSMLDGLLVGAISSGRSPYYCRVASQEARRIAEASGRKEYRIIDGRLRVLREHGIIKASRKAPGGWVLSAP